MNLQYVSDSKGKTTGVFIPISEWEKLKDKYKEIGEEPIDIPAWHKKENRKRVRAYKIGAEEGMDFDMAMEDIEKDL